MARYIDAELIDFSCLKNEFDKARAKVIIMGQPTADVAPIADTVRKMHSEIKERCIKGGIYPAFVASTIDQIEKRDVGGGRR